MADGTLRIGLIGCGGIAPVHLQSYQANERTEVVAVADLNQAAASALAEKAGATAYADYQQMLANEQLDAVGLLTPPANHRAIAEEALVAGLHILSEKPLATTAADAQAMADAAKSAGKLLLVAQCHRFHEPVRRAKAHLAAGDLGEISTYRNRFGYLTGKPDDRTRGRGGILLDNGSHSSYLFRYLVGEVASAFGWAPADQLAQIQDLCVCTMLLQAGNGVGGVIELDGAARPCPNAIEVFGTKGSATIDYGGGPSLFRPAQGEPVPLDDPALPGNHRFQREIDHFVRCVLDGEKPEIGAEEGVADLRVLEAAYEGMTTGETVAV
jgi:predicted dehydrogenase